MKLISQHIHGRFQDGTLTLINAAPQAKTAVSLTIRFPFLTRGDEQSIFPSSLLDDWGQEIRGMALYQWIRKNGDSFPRAELFGMDENGRLTQAFIRDLETDFRFPCWLQPPNTPPLTGMTLIEQIILPPAMSRKELPYPLRRSKATWQTTDTP